MKTIKERIPTSTKVSEFLFLSLLLLFTFRKVRHSFPINKFFHIIYQMIGTASDNCQHALIIDLHQETRHKIKLFAQTVANMLSRQYLCIVFFIVLDLRLTKIGTRRSPFFYVYTSSVLACRQTKRGNHCWLPQCII